MEPTNEIVKAMLDLPHMTWADRELCQKFLDEEVFEPDEEFDDEEALEANQQTWNHLKSLIQSRWSELLGRRAV